MLTFRMLEAAIRQGGSGASGCPANVLALSPVAFWRLGDLTGTTATDSSGNGHNGVYTGSYTLGVAGLQTCDSDKATQFNGVGYVDLSADTTAFCPSSTPWSISLYCNLTAMPASAFTGICVLKTDLSTPFEILMSSNSSYADLAFGSNSFPSTKGRVSLPNGPTGLYHICLTYSGSVIKVYVDKVLSTILSTSSFSSLPNISYLATYTPGNGVDFNGVLDEIAIFSSELSPAQISTL